ncbi:MAG: hypothetical protein ACREJM_01920, partial [Candidatus Saccharimonadales bacterium]
MTKASKGNNSAKTSAKTNGEPVAVLYGLSTIGKSKAGVFRGTDVGPARKAAAKLGLQILTGNGPDLLGLAAKLPAGRIHGHGETIVPFVPRDQYDALERLAGAAPGKNGVEPVSQGPASKPSPRLPANWD